MSIEPEKKPSLLAPLADRYKLTDAGADHIFGKIQTAYLREASTASAASTAARGGAGKLAWIVGSSCAVLALVGVTIHLSRSEPASVTDPAALTAPAPAPPQPVEPAREPERAIAVPSVSVDSLPSVPEAPLAPRAPSKKATAAPGVPEAPVPTARAASADTLEREARLITGAREALAQGDGERALALLSEHAREFPDGWFAADRAAERVVVLCSLGRRAEALQEATAFLASRPKGPLTRRVESSCAGQSITKVGP